VQADRLQLDPQFLAVADGPVEAGVQLHRTLVEGPQQVVVLPHEPLRTALHVRDQKYVEGVAHEVGRTELQGVADLAVLAETAALQVDVSVEFPVALARPRALVERVPVRRQAQDAVAAQDAVVMAGAVDVDLRVLVAAVAALALQHDAQLPLQGQAVVVVAAADAPAPLARRVGGVPWQVGEAPRDLPVRVVEVRPRQVAEVVELEAVAEVQDRKSTRLNSSHVKISYAVFCLKKKRNMRQ